MSLPGAVVDPSPPSTLAEALDRPVASPIFLAEVTCGLSLPVWEEYSPGILYAARVVDEVQVVTANGTDLALVASTVFVTALAQVASTAGSWYWDRDSKVLWIHLADDGDPSDPSYSVEALLVYRFSDGRSDFDGKYWDELLADLPSLADRLPESFKGVVQVGGGRMGLLNQEHFFDRSFNVSPGDGLIAVGSVSVPGRLRQNWAAGKTLLRMGAAGLPEDQYQVIATLANGQLAVDEEEAILDVREIKALLDKQYPFNVYTRAEYPGMREADEGRAVQMAFGRNLGRNPVCIDTTACEFRVAGHPIRSFDGVKVKDPTTGIWNNVAFLHKDEPSGIFTLDPADWQDGLEVSVDFSGWVRDNGTMADNLAEFVQALAIDLGQAYNADSFEEARLSFDGGYLSFDETQRVTFQAPSIYLDSQASALETIQALLAENRTYLMVNEVGELVLQPFRNYQAADLPVVLEEIDTLGAGLQREPISTSATKITKAIVYYAQRPQESVKSVQIYEVPAQQYKRRAPTPVVVTVESHFTAQDDAKWLAETLVTEERVDPATYRLTMKWRPWLWLLGQHIHFISERHGLDVVVEIIGRSRNLKAREVQLLLGNLRGFEEASGFWSEDDEVTPAGDPLDWPSAGQVPGDASQHIRHQTGIWHNDLDMATDTPLTALDRAVSLWQ